MKVHDCVQGSPEWAALRAGIPTASEFHRIVTATGKLRTAPNSDRLSQGAQTYLCELIAEDFVGPLDMGKSQFMLRGSEMETEAVNYYEFTRDVDTQVVGFITNDAGTVGCSPDRLVGDGEVGFAEGGGCEIKCLSAGKHVQCLFGMAVEFKPQVQGCMWLTGRSWWDLLAYNPFMPKALVRFERDPEFIEALAASVAEFLIRLAQARAQVKAMVAPATEAA